MKKCRFCENESVKNVIVPVKDGKKKYSVCERHVEKAMEKAEKIKHGKIRVIEKANSWEINDGFSMINAIAFLANRVEKAARKMLSDHAVTDLVDNEGDPLPSTLDLNAVITGSDLEKQIPAIETLSQYAHKLNILLERIEKSEVKK